MKLHIATAVGLLFITGCKLSDGRPAAPSAVAPPAAECDAATHRSLQAWADAGFSGTVTVATRGTVDCAVGFGKADRATGRPNTVDTVFSLGSIAKSFTAVAVLDLVDSGRLRLDDRAGDLVPRLSGPAADATIEQLLLHTSGINGSHGRDHEPLDREQAIRAISQLDRAFKPGTNFLYSNAGYTLLGIIVETVSKRPFRDFVVANVLTLPDGEVVGGFWDGTPAAPGPRAVGYLGGEPSTVMGQFKGPHWAVDGNGDIAMTTAQLARWTSALFAGRIVPKRVVERLLTPGYRGKDGESESPGWVVFDRSVFGRRVLTSAGGGGDVGHNAIVAWLPDQQRVLAIASNASRITAERLMASVGRELAAGRPLPVPRGTGDNVDPSRLRAVAGRYTLPSGDTIVVAVSGRRLTASASGADAVAALFPLGADQLTKRSRAQERQVMALLEGRTTEGRKERSGLEKGFGRIAAIELVGTIVDDGELKTYVEVTAGGKPVLLWYSLNEHGGIEAAEGPTPPPALRLIPAGPSRFRPDSLARTAPQVIVRFDGERMVIASDSGQTIAASAR